MRYFMNPKYTMAGNDRCVTLFKFIFSHYGDFCREIFPDGFVQSGYYGLFYTTPEYEYWVYRQHRVFYYKEARRYNKHYQVSPRISFEQYSADFLAPEVNPELCMLQLFINGLQRIFRSFSIVYDEKKRSYNRQGIEFEQNLAAVMPLFIADFDRFGDADLHSFRSYDYNHAIDLKPVYAFIFRLMKTKKLDWYFQEVDPAVFDGFMSVVERSWAELEIDKMMSAKRRLGLVDQDEAVYRQEQRAKKVAEELMLSVMKVPQTVEAYFEVYGKLPENYPPIG